MKKLLFAAAATAALVAAAPASAEVYFGAGPYGGIELGVGPRDGWREHGWREHWRGAYAYDCPVTRERIVTPSGRVIIRTRRDCD
jgi:hypothetical protein